MKAQGLNLNCEVFDVFRDRMDVAITALMNNLIAKNMMEGSITAKLGVELSRHTTDDGEIVYMPEITPTISIKIGSTCKMECPKKGGFMMKMGGEDGFIVGSTQVSMEELLEGKGGGT